MIVRQLDDAKVARIKSLAREKRTSAEALAREAIHQLADRLTVDEKKALVRRAWAKFEAARIRDAVQTPGWMLIREDRDRDH